MKRLIVDRVEGGFAVCQTEEEAMVNIPLSAFDFEVKEGNVIAESGDCYELLRGEEESRRKELFGLADSLFDE